MSKDQWKIRIDNFIATLRRTIEVYTKHEMDVYSGYATFYFLMSAVPLLMMIISLINLLPWFSVEQMSTVLTTLIPDIPQLQRLILSVIINLNRQSGQLTAYIFALTSLWSGSHGVNSMMVALEKINHTQNDRIRERPKAIIYTVIFTFLIPSMLLFQMLRSWIMNAVTYIFTLLSLESVITAIHEIIEVSGVITLAAMILVVVMTYTFLPAGKRTVRSQLPGSILTCLFWVLFTNAFGFFIKRFWKMSSVYGALAAVFLAAMWLKFIVVILFYGASLNRALQVKVSRDCST